MFAIVVVVVILLLLLVLLINFMVAVWRIAVTAFGMSTKVFYTSCPFSTAMGDRLRTGKPPLCVTSYRGKLSLPSSAGR